MTIVTIIKKCNSNTTALRQIKEHLLQIDQHVTAIKNVLKKTDFEYINKEEL
jgi:hypothetical protein